MGWKEVYHEVLNKNSMIPKLPSGEGVISNSMKKKHVSRPYCGNVVLIQSDDEVIATKNAPLMGWKPFITGKLDLYPTPGTHLGIMYGEKYARPLAAKLQQCLLQSCRHQVEQ